MGELIISSVDESPETSRTDNLRYSTILGNQIIGLHWRSFGVPWSLLPLTYEKLVGIGFSIGYDLRCTKVGRKRSLTTVGVLSLRLISDVAGLPVQAVSTAILYLYAPNFLFVTYFIPILATSGHYRMSILDPSLKPLQQKLMV
jgi:hypothetical protein